MSLWKPKNAVLAKKTQIFEAPIAPPKKHAHKQRNNKHHVAPADGLKNCAVSFSPKTIGCPEPFPWRLRVPWEIEAIKQPSLEEEIAKPPP